MRARILTWNGDTRLNLKMQSYVDSSLFVKT